jgi:hypothetical protein
MVKYFDGTVSRIQMRDLEKLNPWRWLPFRKQPKRVILSNIVPIDEQHLFPILAGKASGLWGGEEVADFEDEIIPLLEKVICHQVRIAVIGESGEKIFTIESKK